MTTGGTRRFHGRHRIRGRVGYRAGMDTSRRRAEGIARKERQAGIDPDDEAARWLTEHDPKPEPGRSKHATKSKMLHRFRQRRR